jgi:hypothetical protein
MLAFVAAWNQELVNREGFEWVCERLDENVAGGNSFSCTANFEGRTYTVHISVRGITANGLIDGIVLQNAVVSRTYEYTMEMCRARRAILDIDNRTWRTELGSIVAHCESAGKTWSNPDSPRDEVSAAIIRLSGASNPFWADNNDSDRVCPVNDDPDCAPEGRCRVVIDNLTSMNRENEALVKFAQEKRQDIYTDLECVTEEDNISDENRQRYNAECLRTYNMGRTGRRVEGLLYSFTCYNSEFVGFPTPEEVCASRVNTLGRALIPNPANQMADIARFVNNVITACQGVDDDAVAQARIGWCNFGFDRLTAIGVNPEDTAIVENARTACYGNMAKLGEIEDAWCRIHVESDAPEANPTEACANAPNRATIMNPPSEETPEAECQRLTDALANQNSGYDFHFRERFRECVNLYHYTNTEEGRECMRQDIAAFTRSLNLDLFSNASLNCYNMEAARTQISNNTSVLQLMGSGLLRGGSNITLRCEGQRRPGQEDDAWPDGTPGVCGRPGTPPAVEEPTEPVPVFSDTDLDNIFDGLPISEED